MAQSTLPRFALWSVGAAIAVLYIHAVFFLPPAYSDQFQEIYATFTRAPLAYLSSLEGLYFRPGETIVRYLIVYLFGYHPYSYNYFQMSYVVLVAAAALSLIPSRTWIDAGAGIVALTFLFGHHAFLAVLEPNIAISNGLVLLLMLVVLHLVQSKGQLSWQIVGIVISVAAVLTKEVGLVVPFTIAAAAMLGFPGVRRWTAVVLVILTLAYIAFRLQTVPEEIRTVTKSGKATSLSGFLANVTAAPVMIVTGEPYDGKWSEFLRHGFYPWRIIRIALGFATVALIAIAFFLRKAAVEAFPNTELVDRKWILLLLGVIAASSALAFHYTRHRFGAMTLPVAFLLVDRSLRIVLWRLSNLEGRTWVRSLAVSLLFAFSLAWSSRVADGFFVLRNYGAKIMLGWVEQFDAHQKHESEDPKSLPYLYSFFWAAEAMPWPTIQLDPPFVKFWLGEDGVMNR